MDQFEFETDDESLGFCNTIILEMVKLFAIGESEAVGRVNRFWKGQKIVGEDDLVYHEEENYWANTIYYGKDSYWWTNPPDLKPLPYP